jgi:hypothetical protein
MAAGNNSELVSAILAGLSKLDDEDILDDILMLLTVEYKCGSRIAPKCKKDSHACDVRSGKCVTKNSITKNSEAKLKTLYGSDYLYDEVNGLIGPKKQVMNYVKYLDAQPMEVISNDELASNVDLSERDKKIIKLFSECIFNIQGNK